MKLITATGVSQIVAASRVISSYVLSGPVQNGTPLKRRESFLFLTGMGALTPSSPCA
jgi:hypothetical protein